MKAKNVKKRLNARVRAHAAMMVRGSTEFKVQQRIDSGGFTRPGSNNK